MKKENLVLEVSPSQLTPYGNLMVAFFDKVQDKAKVDENGDKILNKNGKAELEKVATLYIHIQSSDDKYSVTKKKASERRNKAGQVAHEKQLFARAYDRYIQIKNSGGVVDIEKAALIKRVAELEANASKKIEPKNLKKIEPKKVELNESKEEKESK